MHEYVTCVINLRRQVSRMRDIIIRGYLANDSAVYSYNCIICAISTEGPAIFPQQYRVSVFTQQLL